MIRAEAVKVTTVKTKVTAVALLSLQVVEVTVVAVALSPRQPMVQPWSHSASVLCLPILAGKTFVHLYYSYSPAPPVANFIARHDTLRAVVRWSLLPLLGASWMALNSGPWVTMAVVILLIFLMGVGAGVTLRRTQFRRQA